MSSRQLALSGLICIIGITATVANSQTSVTPSVRAGAYTEEQAIRGQALYYEHCLACHGEEMTGQDQAPPLAGPQFSSLWDGESLWALVERIDSMPPTAPGSLSRPEAVDLLTYLLWYNGLPIGETPLSAEPRVLSGMAFETPPLLDQ